MRYGRRFWIGILVVGVLAVALALFAAGRKGALAAQGTIIYVDAEAVGRDDGTTWRNAYRDLQDALEEAEPLDQIWVAAGTYKPTRRLVDDDPRSATFQMVNGVAIFGGFDSDEMSPNWHERDWEVYKTILSGDIGIEGSPLDNVYHVFYHTEDLGLDSTSVLDGFTITGGYADYEESKGRGGGMVSEGSSVTLRNITFLNNSAGYGGALWVSAPVPEEMTVTLTNVAFVSNTAVEGGAVLIEGAEAIPWVIGDIVFANCIFWSNVAERGGGVAITWGEEDADAPPIRFTNCTFNSNQAASGGGAYVSEESKGLGWFMVTNSILWDDTADEIYVEDGASPPLVTYSDIQDGFDGEGNIDEDPAFVNPEVGDLHLQPYTSCIDVGSNDAPDLPLFDFEGDSRILDGDVFGPIVDMGVDEVKYPYPVEISVTPYIPTNVIRLRPGVVVDVAILSTDDFDAVAEVAADMVEFAGATHVGFTFVDVNKDGHDDVLLDFVTEDMVDLDKDSTEATLTGETLEGVPFEGTDEVKVR